MARRSSAGRYSVGDRSAPSLGAAISLGQHLLAQAGPVEEETSMYVRDFGGKVLARITRRPDNIIITVSDKEVVHN